MAKSYLLRAAGLNPLEARLDSDSDQYHRENRVSSVLILLKRGLIRTGVCIITTQEVISLNPLEARLDSDSKEWKGFNTSGGS